ncbi:MULTISPECIES: transcription termination/antitermination NusG family protein [Yersinia]|uniref:transcription termination/antitermination NusG family protein n=1 Tax=Yersinia TaxID=629 RepID=UPI000EB4C454|nr:transcription termination/antitermination NusG family protein [Yersinia sp. IP36721]
MERWYLTCHKPGKKNLLHAQIALERLNIMVFSPILRTYRSRADRPGQIRQVIEPLFPGYMFIYFNPEIHTPSKVERNPGISHLVRFAGGFPNISEAVIDSVMCLPMCSQAVSHLNKNNHQSNNKLSSLNSQQQKKFKTLIEEENGEVRNSLFYSFIEEIN